MGENQLGPAAVVPDHRVRFRLGPPQHHMGPREQRQGHAVGLQDGVQDQDVDGPLVHESDQAQVLVVDALDPAGHVAAKGLEGLRAVDAVMGRAEGDPGGVRCLSVRCGLEQGRQQGKAGGEGPGKHGSSLPPE